MLKVHVLDSNYGSKYIFKLYNETQDFEFDSCMCHSIQSDGVTARRAAWGPIGKCERCRCVQTHYTHPFIILCPHRFTNHPLPSVECKRDTHVKSSSNAPRCSMPCSASSKVHACREAMTSFPHTEYVITPKIKKLTPEGFGILSHTLKCMNVVVLYNRISNQMYNYFKDR